MWTLYSERLFQTQGTWAYAAVGGEQQSLKLATGIAQQKTERSKGISWPGAARSTSGLLVSPLAMAFGLTKIPGA